MITRLQNAHKMAYLLEQYPEHNMDKIIALFQLPAIDINAAIWAAIDAGLISEPDKAENGAVRLLKKPKTWDFGEVIPYLCDNILYCFSKLAERQQDMEENYLSQWTSGYSSQDTLIAEKLLTEGKKLATYDIEDGENAYTFFTLYENRGHKWGQVQFKKNPLKNKRNKTAE